MTNFTGEQILDLPMPPNDARAATIRDYLKELLQVVWEKGEDFSGKKPFGNSGWHRDIYAALVNAGAIEGRFCDGDLDDYDRPTGEILIADAIDALCKVYR